MNILIPMAGRGKRFLDEGYTTPKPMIDIKGQPMIFRVVQNLGISPIDEDDNLVFLCLSSFLDSEYGLRFRNLMDECVKRYTVIEVPSVTDGAACTALLAEDLINSDEPLFITDCDHLIKDLAHPWTGLDYFKKRDVSGGVWCHLSDHPKWSYTKVRDGLVREIAEKQVISELANTGDYYYKHGAEFVDYAHAMIDKNDRVKGEFYIAPVFNYYLADNKPLGAFVLNQMVPLGTPADLEEYLG